MYEGDYDEDALSRLLRTSRTVLLSTEHNGFNSLLQRMIKPAPSDMYALQEYEPLKDEAEIKSCFMEFFNYMLCVHACDSAVISTVNLAKLMYYQTPGPLFPCTPQSPANTGHEL